MVICVHLFLLKGFVSGPSNEKKQKKLTILKEVSLYLFLEIQNVKISFAHA